MAQVRMFGGSIGIAASTAILGVKERHQLLDTQAITPAQLNSLRDVAHTLSFQQIQSIRQAYTGAFDQSMIVCSVISGLCLVVTLGCWQKNPITMEERRKQLFENEALRQKALAEARAEAKDTAEAEGTAEAEAGLKA